MTSEASNDFDLESLARSIQRITDELRQQASKAVNVSLTVRNWLIGHYIAEFELNGSDRAAYGDGLLDKLAGRLSELSVKTCDKRRLYQYLRFYEAYPSIVRSLTAQSRKLLLSEVSDPAPSEKVRSLTAQSQTPLLQALSYTHIEPPRLVVYVPMEQGKTHHALIELEAAGVVVQPGQQPPQRNTRLSIVARNALKYVLEERAAYDVEKQVEAGKLSLADVNALAQKGGEISSGVISIIFGTGNRKWRCHSSPATSATKRSRPRKHTKNCVTSSARRSTSR